jgi:hypothetical protein
LPGPVFDAASPSFQSNAGDGIEESSFCNDEDDKDTIETAHSTILYNQLSLLFQEASPSVFAGGHLPIPLIHDGGPASYMPHFFLGQAVSLNESPLPDLPPYVSEALHARLTSHYMRETETWCDTTD